MGEDTNTQLAYYRQDTRNTLAQLGSNLKNGLGSPEAARRLEQYGYNKLQELNKESTLHK